MLTGNLFKSKRERDQEKKRKSREAFRKAERAVERLRDESQRLKNERGRIWNDAKTSLSTGDKNGAHRTLQSIRAMEVQMMQIEKRRGSAERMLARLRFSSTGEEIAEALKSVSDSVSIEPVRLDSTFAEITERFEDQAEVERIWESVHVEEVAGLDGQHEGIPPLDAMMKNLEQEVALEVRAGAERATHELDDEIDAGRARLKNLLEEQK